VITTIAIFVAASGQSLMAANTLAGGSGVGSGSNARSGPAAGGSIGTASSVSASGFTLTTSAGQKVTIKEASSTTYEPGTSPASISAVTDGAPVRYGDVRPVTTPSTRSRSTRESP
jgi:hypothetical protein